MDVIYSRKNAIFSAGGVLLDKKTNRVYLIRSELGDEWLLPKGRIEREESPREAAKREIFEETGYRNNPKELISVQIRTDKKDPSKVKVIFWYKSDLASACRESNTQEKDEHYVGEWMSVEDAQRKIQWETDKSLLSLI